MFDPSTTRIAGQLIRDRRNAASDEGRDNAPSPRQIYSRSVRRYDRVWSDYETNTSRAETGRYRAAPSATFSPRRLHVVRNESRISRIILHVTSGNQFLNGPAALGSDSAGDSNVANDHRIDRIIAHFVVLNNGTVVYTHDVGHILNGVAGGNGIEIEFAGAYGLQLNTGGRTRHRAAENPADSLGRLSPIAIRAGRELVGELAKFIPTIRTIHPHGEFNQNKAATCPGPDVWLNVGEYCARNISSLSTSATLDSTIDPQQRNPAYQRHM